MTATANNLHTLPYGYFALMLLLAMGTATYGVLKLRSVVAGYRSSVEQSDRLVIGFFNVVISLTAIGAILFIAI
jgi:hypothetical protein